MTFRQYDPAIGRFNGMDRLAEFAYHMTPYRFAFNNPIIFSDPSGLFESRREAREYRRDNNIRGGRISKQEDGSYAIEGKGGYHFQAGDDSGASFDMFPNDGVVQSVLVTADKSDIADKRAAQINRLKYDLQIQKEEFQWGLIGNGKSPYVTINSRLQAIGNMAEVSSLVTAPIVAASSRTTSVTAEISEDVAVYLSKTTNGTVQYVGITNNIAIRQAQHLRGLGINIEPLLQGLSRADAKAVEQVLIEMHGLGKNGGTLLNKINSIGESNPIYAEALNRGRQLLQSVGY